MAERYTRRINLYLNGKEVQNDIKSIKGAMAQLTNQQAKMVIGSDEYVAAGKKIRQLKGILSEHNSSLQVTQTLWQKAAGVVKKFLPVLSVGTLIAGVGKFISKMNDAVKAADNFAERLDNLSALTGLEGSELDQLGEIAKKTSVKITDGNVRIKQSADDIVDAYTKVGSQRPELLKNAAALASVTEDAIILSEAAKSELEPAVAGLTTTMNQFNLGASESRRIINAMAAGSKAGAADIPYLTQAIEKSGTTMNLMNVSLEENIGLIETIAPFYSKAEMAGNSLDKVFLKMKASQIGYKDGVFSVEAALAELQTRFSNGETAVELFGVEHAKMAELLVQNRSEVDKYTKAVTGTNVAIEQAAKNTNNAKAIQAQARNEWHNMSLELGKNLSPAMSSVIKAAGSLASAFTRLIQTKGSEKLREDRIEMNNLFTAIKHTKEGTEERKKAIDDLNTTYAKYLPNLLTEQSTLVEIEKAQRGANNELIKNIQLKLREEELEVLGRKQKDIMDNILGDVAKRKGKSLVPAAESEIFTLLDEMANMKSIDEAKDKLGAFAKVYRDASKNIGTYSENIQQFFELFRIGKDQQILLESINKISGTLNNPTPTPGSVKPDGNPETPTPVGGSTETIKAGFEIAFQKEQTLLKEEFLQKKITKQQFDQEMYALEMANLVAMRELYKKHNGDFLSIEGQIIDKKLAWSQQFDAMLVISKTVTETLLEEERNMFADIESEMDQHMLNYQAALDQETEATIDAELKKAEAREKAKEAEIQNSVAAGAAAIENAETIEEAGKAVLNSIRDQIKAYLAEAIAIAAVKALKSVPFPFNIIAATVAGGAAALLFNKLIPKFAEGKYPDAEFVGKPKTGMYGTKPQLGIFNEVPGEPEMVIDGKTNRKISRNYPEIQEAIYAIRDGREPGSIAPNANTSNPVPNPMLDSLFSLREKHNAGPSELAVKYFAEGYYPFRKRINHSGSKSGSANSKTGSANQTADGYDSRFLKDLATAVDKLSQNIDYQTKNPPRPVVAVETIEKARKKYIEVEQTRGL